MMGPLTANQGGQASTQTRVQFLRATTKNGDHGAGQGGGATCSGKEANGKLEKLFTLTIPNK